MTHGIVLTNQSNDTIRKMTSQINNASTGIMGLGTQTSVLAKSAFKPSGTSIIFGGGNLTSQMSKLNFNTDKKDRNPNYKFVFNIDINYCSI